MSGPLNELARARSHAKLAENIAHVVFDGTLGEIQVLGNLAIGCAPGNQRKYLAFALGQLLNVGR